MFSVLLAVVLVSCEKSQNIEFYSNKEYSGVSRLNRGQIKTDINMNQLIRL